MFRGGHRSGSGPSVLDVTSRLCLDVNVLFADLRGKVQRLRPTACSDLVSYATTGRFPGGATQLIISVPMIEQWESVLQRHFGYNRSDASEAAWLLHDIAKEGPLPFSTLVVVGSGFVPFASEQEAEAAARGRASRASGEEAGRIFDEIEDDRHVLLTAVAGRADILVTTNMRDFRRGKLLEFDREDMFVVPAPDHHLVVGTPGFATHWLRQGIIPNWNLVSSRGNEFRLKATGLEEP
ncbi:MAG: PIN domain-containing protein [Acidimicrobiaceae bacterium]|nr:PIN domain-containing protein [Acidimicrobiaceae bacterium]